MTAGPKFGDAIAGLLPCPFCGSTNPELIGMTDSGYVECGSCLATMPEHDPDVPNSTQRWNTRLSALPLAHPAAPQGEDTVTVPLMTEEDVWHDWACKDRSVVGETEAHLEGWAAACRYYGLIKPALAPAAIASGREGAEQPRVGDETPEHLRWKGEGPEPRRWTAADGTIVYRSYEDYCDD